MRLGLHKAFGHIIRSARFCNLSMSSDKDCGKSMMEDWAYIFYDWPDTGCIEKQQIITWYLSTFSVAYLESIVELLLSCIRTLYVILTRVPAADVVNLFITPILKSLMILAI